MVAILIYIRSPEYQDHIYGEFEGGGTQVMVLSAVPFENLGMPEVAPLSTGARSEHIQHTLYKGMVLPIAALCGALLIWLTVIVKTRAGTP